MCSNVHRKKRAFLDLSGCYAHDGMLCQIMDYCFLVIAEGVSVVFSGKGCPWLLGDPDYACPKNVQNVMFLTSIRTHSGDISQCGQDGNSGDPSLITPSRRFAGGLLLKPGSNMLCTTTITCGHYTPDLVIF